MLGILIKWVLLTLALLFIAWVVPGISFTGYAAAFIAALAIGIINLFIRPILLLLLIPINFLTLGLFTFVINALLFWFVSTIVSGFVIAGFLDALFGSIILSLLSLFIDRINL